MRDELCCCEYPRTSDGETRHLLQCFCECDEIDQLADDSVNACCATCCPCCEDIDPNGGKKALPQSARRELLRKFFLTVEDRTRLPWIGGAVRVNAGAAFAPLVLQALRLLCGTFVWAPWVLFWLTAAGAHLLWLHLACLALPWRTDYFVSWIAFSIVGIYRDYLALVLPTQGIGVALAMHLLLCVTAVAFAAAVLQRPPRRRSGSEDYDEAPSEDVRADKASGWPLPPDRTYLCRVCGHRVCRRDHHCVWINQCVGLHNHRAFLAFVVAFTVLAISYACMAVAAAAAAAGEGAWEHLGSLAAARKVPLPVAGALYAFVGGLFTASLALAQLSNISAGLTTHERKRLAKVGWREGAAAAAAKRSRPGRHPFDHGGTLANWKAWLRARRGAGEDDDGGDGKGRACLI